MTGNTIAEPFTPMPESEGGPAIAKNRRYHPLPCHTQQGISVTAGQTQTKRPAWGEVALPIARRLGGDAEQKNPAENPTQAWKTEHGTPKIRSCVFAKPIDPKQNPMCLSPKIKAPQLVVDRDVFFHLRQQMSGLSATGARC